MKRHVREIEPQPIGGEHPVIGWLALIAMVAAVLCILWLRVAVVGTRDLERTFSQNGQTMPKKHTHPHSLRKKAEDAAAQSRWATGFSH